jgi:hypothetical protein
MGHDKQKGNLKMKTKQRLTSEEHQTIGAELHAIRGRLFAVGHCVLEAYPKQSRAVMAYLKAADALDRLRSELDGTAYMEHPTDFSTKWYYSGPADNTTSGQAIDCRPPDGQGPIPQKENDAE